MSSRYSSWELYAFLENGDDQLKKNFNRSPKVPITVFPININFIFDSEF